jgi:hypothetical protein
VNKISAALVKAQKEFGPALKTSSNPHFRSKYADLSACVEAVLDGLNNNGIMLLQGTHPCEDGVIVETLFIHESGEQISAGKLHVPAAKQDPQGYGSALTYARRYSLMAACGIAPEDDDGNAASKKPAKPVEKPESKPAPAETQSTALSVDKHDPWKIRITTSPEASMADYMAMAFQATNKMLEFTTSEKDIMNLFKVNRVIYDKVKAEDASIYNEIMDAFKTTKARFAKAE